MRSQRIQALREARRAAVPTSVQRAEQPAPRVEEPTKPMPRRTRQRERTPTVQKIFDAEESAVADFIDEVNSESDLSGFRKDPAVAAIYANLQGHAAVARGNIAALLDRVAALEKRLAEIETKAFEYAGVHQRAIEYRRGQGVTYKGNLFVALKNNPGDIPGPDWQLAVPKGKDGDNAR